MTLTYNLDVRTAGVEEVPGHLVYYSLTGAANSWTQITDISAQASDNVVGVYTKSTIVNFSSPWAANSTIYFLWADDNSGGTDAILTIDNVKWSLPAPPTIISCTNLTNQTVLQCRSSTTMSVVAAGGNYQWTRNGVDIPGATASSYTIANMQAADAGTYTVRVFNGLGSTSCPPVTVTYMADIVPPTILYALGSTNPIEITLLFSEPIDTNDLANIPFNFSLYDTVSLVPLGITNALAPNRTTLILQTEPRLPDTKYTLEMNSVVDACAGNAMANPTVVAVHSICTSLLPLTAVWRYDDVTDTNAIAANWAQPGYDDSVAPWKSGAGPFDAKRGAAGAAGTDCRNVALFGLGNVGTCINLTSPLTGTNLVLANFRTHFYYGGNPSDAILQLIGQVDDGAVLYLNGTELQRVRMPAGTLLRTTFATGGPADTDPSATFQFVAPAALLNGNNLLAVDVRQNNLTSSDITMGLQVKAVTTVPLVQPPVLTIVLNGDGSVTVSWNGGGTLICTNDPTTPRASWTVLGTTNPRTFAAGTLAAYRFYAVRLP